MKYHLSAYTIKIGEENNKVYLYNTFSGSIIKLDTNKYYNLSNNLLEEKEIDHFNELKLQGFIVSESTNEYLKMKITSNNIQQSDLIDTLSYVIAPTLNCNYNCSYCFESKENRMQKMTQKTATDIINFIIQQIKVIKTIKKVKVTWFGGEPLLLYDLIVDFSQKLIEKLKEINVEYQANMISNGYFLTPEKALVLSQKCNLKHVQITLDGFEDTYAKKKQTSKESFNVVVTNIIKSCNNFKITVRLNTDKTNYKEMKDLSKYLLKECGLKDKIQIYLAEIRNYNKENMCNFYCAGEFLSTRNDFNEFLYKNKLTNKYKMSEPPCFEPNFCGIIKKHNYAIGPGGELYKCEHHFGDADKVIGDIYNGLYYNIQYKKYLEGNIDPECVKCNLNPCCRSDCQAMYECHKHKGKCLIYDDLLKNLTNYVQLYIKKSNNQS